MTSALEIEDRRALGEERPTLGMIAVAAFYRDADWGATYTDMTPELQTRWEMAADAVMFEVLKRVDPGTPTAAAQGGQEARR